MVKVHLTSNLQKYFPKSKLEIDADTILDVLQKMNQIAPRFSSYILEDDNSIRKHVNIFIDGELLPKSATQTKLKDKLFTLCKLYPEGK